MERYGLDALCVSRPQNVFYLSNFDSNILWNWANVAFAVLPRDPARPATVVVPGLDLATQLTNPTWMPEVRIYTLKGFGGEVLPADIRPQVHPGGRLGEYEQRALDLFARTPGIQAGTPAAAFAAILRDLKLDRGRLGCDDIRLGRQMTDAHLPDATAIDALDILREIRLVKTEAEIELMRGAAQRNEAALRAAIAATRPGVRWQEVVDAYQIEMIRQGGRGVYLIRGAGEFAGVRVGVDYAIKPGDLVFYDALGQYRHYNGDIGRTAYVGEAPDEVRRAFNAVRKGWERACEIMRPGMSAHEVGALVRDTIRQSGFPAFSTTTPHSLGLEHFDHPQTHGFYQDFVLEENCVINVDMPFVEFGWGAMHLEDTVVLRRDGVEFLTSNQTALIEIPD